MSRLVWLSIIGIGLITWVASVAPARLQAQVHLVSAEPPTITACSGPESWDSAWAPEIRGTTHTTAHSYRCGDGTIHVYAALYAEQSPDAEALSDAQSVVPHVWVKHSSSASIEAAEGFPVNQYGLSVDEQRLVIWTWYAIGTDHHQHRWSAKLAEVINALTFKPQPAAILVVASEGAGEEGERILAQATKDLWSWYRGLSFEDGGTG